MKCKLKVFENINCNFEKGFELKIRESVTYMLRFYLKIIFYVYIKMDIDKVWVEENIDVIMNTFLASHPQFQSKEKSTQSAKRRHKKNILENMDTMMYRPIYQIARFTKKQQKCYKKNRG